MTSNIQKLAVEEAFKTSHSLSSIAWLSSGLFCISVCSSFIHPCHPSSFPVPWPHSWNLLNLFSSITCTLITSSCETMGCGWLDIAHVLISGLVCINRLFSQQAKQEHMLRLHGNVWLRYMCLFHWYPHNCLEFTVFTTSASMWSFVENDCWAQEQVGMILSILCWKRRLQLLLHSNFHILKLRLNNNLCVIHNFWVEKVWKTVHLDWETSL